MQHMVITIQSGLSVYDYEVILSSRYRIFMLIFPLCICINSCSNKCNYYNNSDYYALKNYEYINFFTCSIYIDAD